jgi:hypothetical protein
MVCGETLEYLASSRAATCYYCGKTDPAHIICKAGHYVCDACHGRNVVASIIRYLEETTQQSPQAIAEQLFTFPSLPMLGCEHALIAAGALLVGLRNSGRLPVTEEMLQEAIQRTQRQAIGGYCGLTGVCGVAVGIGAAFSVLLSAACPKDKETRLTMEVVSRIVQSIAELTGPCCCKAFVRVALGVAEAACGEIWGISFSPTKEPICTHGEVHPHGCREEKCPYFAR